MLVNWKMYSFKRSKVRPCISYQTTIILVSVRMPKVEIIYFELSVSECELKHLRRKHPLQFMCAYLNIKSLRYTFCLIEELLTSNIVDMLFLAETKIDETFTDTQFKVNDFHFWRADRTTDAAFSSNGECYWPSTCR
jgi:hypothetical protein